MLRKPGEQNNPVVETVSLNDLRYNMYGGARYPAPAVVGSFGTGVGGAIGNSMANSGAMIANATAAAHPKRHWAAAKPKQVGACRYRQADRSLSRNQERPSEGGGKWALET